MSVMDGMNLHGESRKTGNDILGTFLYLQILFQGNTSILLPLVFF